jgi:pimeloyl-ACP methyl ester carboxylesterase
MTRLYLFSGLGADTRLFRKLGPIEGIEIVPLPWIKPADAKTLGDYAKLLLKAYDFKNPFFLGGVSMGGMVAQELAQRIDPEGLVLISTATSREEMPLLFDWARKLRLASLMNKSFLENLALLGDKFTIKSEEGRKLFLDMLKDSDPDFMRFGAQAILHWEPPKCDLPVVRIHGTADRVFPFAKVKDAIPVQGGNHFMVFEKGEEVTAILKKQLI